MSEAATARILAAIENELAEVTTSGGARHLPAPGLPLAVARVLLKEHYSHPDGSLLRYWRGAFWRWHRNHWLEAEEAEVRSVAYRFTDNATFTDYVGKEKVPTEKRHRHPTGGGR